MPKNKISIIFFDKINQGRSLKSLSQESKDPALIKKLILKILNKIVKECHIKERVVASVIIVDGYTMKEFNKRFRKKSKEASALSFPLGLESEFITPSKGLFLGDIVIDTEKIAEESKDFKKSLKENIVHAFLHLLSYNHNTEKQLERMKEEEKKLTRALGDI